MARTVAEVDKDLRDVETRTTQRERVADVQGNRLDTLEEQSKALETDHRATLRAHEEVRREIEKTLKLLQHQVEELQKDRDRWASRFWTFVIPLSVMVVGALVLAALGLKKP